MDQKTAVIIGASGMVGSFVLEQLLKDERFKLVRSLGRRTLNISHPKLQQEILNFNNTMDYSQKFGEGNVIFCCVGTTRKKVKGDKEEYRKVDFDIPVNAAKIGVDKGYQQYYLVSAIGADSTSSNFYLKLKGETENAIQAMPIESIGIFQPSILLGSREESRPGEQTMQKLMKIFSRLLIGSFKKYRAIDAKEVANAMVEASHVNKTGVTWYKYAEMVNL
jgi:uncharacterized protein YbjT (DUF2867 family)